MRTAWDEICVQVQEELMIQCVIYDATVRGIVRRLLEGIAQRERESLWLQTEPGIFWQGHRSHEEEPATDLEDIVEYITTEHVYVAAEQWSNPRIRAYIRRSRTWD